MKNEILLLTVLISGFSLFGQQYKVSDKLIITQLTDNTYVHTCENNNGLIFINDNEALIVSTPDSKEDTQNLIDWVRKERHASIIAYVIDMWHPDGMGGLDVVQRNGIKTYAYELTRQIAKEKRLPIPQIGFDPKTEIQVGNEKVICQFLGEAHTKDGVVVWIPSERILFGGNAIRNLNGWVGNIRDANLDEWSETAANIRREYGSARIVVPGHGKYGGANLIDYTIDLFKCPRHDSVKSSSDMSYNPDFRTIDYPFMKAESDTLIDGRQILRNAIMIVQDATKYVEIESPQIDYQSDKGRIDSATGRVKIYDKRSGKETLRTDVNYERLIVYKYNDSVGLVVIVRRITNSNR